MSDKKFICLKCGYEQDDCKYKCKWCADGYSFADNPNYIAPQKLSSEDNSCVLAIDNKE